MTASRTRRLSGMVLVLALIFTACTDDDNDTAVALYDTWATDLTPLGHDGFSHITFNADGSFTSDLEFVVAGSDCFLDRTTTGTFEADEASITMTHESGTQAVTLCTDENEAAIHDERSLTADEIAESNAVGELMWNVEGGVLTMTDGADLTRTYTPVE